MKPARSEKVIREEIDALEKRYSFLKKGQKGPGAGIAPAVKNLKGNELKAFKRWDVLVSELVEAVARELRKNKNKIHRPRRYVKREEPLYDY